jgi:uronate dehydrogenase
MVVQRKILVTGLSGVVGSAIRPALEKGYHVSSLTRRGAPGLARERNFQADIGELEAIRPAFSGVDTVVHLAATGGVQSPMGTRTGFSELQRTNIVGTYNVFEAAANAGLRT